MGKITQEVYIEMLEKLPDGNFKIKYPKVKSKSGVMQVEVSLGLWENPPLTLIKYTSI